MLSVKYKKSKLILSKGRKLGSQGYENRFCLVSSFFYTEKSIDLARFNLKRECDESFKNDLFLFFPRLNSNMRKTCHPTQESLSKDRNVNEN